MPGYSAAAGCASPSRTTFASPTPKKKPSSTRPRPSRRIERALARAGHRVEPLRRHGARVAPRHAARGVRAGHRLQPGRGAPRQDAARVLPRALRGARASRRPGSDAYTLCVTLDKALTKKQLAGWGVPSPRGRFVTRASLRQRRARRAALPRHREAELRGLEQGHRPGQRRRGSDRARRASSTSSLAKYPDGALVERYVPGVDVRVVHVEGLPRLPAGRDGRRPGVRAALRRSSTTALAQRRHAAASTRRAPARLPAGDARAPARSRRRATLSRVRAARRRGARLPRRRRRRGLVPQRDGDPELRAATARSSRRRAPSGSTTTRRSSPSCASAATRHGLTRAARRDQAARPRGRGARACASGSPST